MPQTNPFHSLVPRELTDTELARSIRLNIESELDAINLYSAHLDATKNPEAIAILKHIMDEEKEHASLFWELIRRLDPPQDGHFQEASEKYRLIVAGAPEEVVEAVGRNGKEPPTARDAAVENRLTVGNLRK